MSNMENDNGFFRGRRMIDVMDSQITWMLPNVTEVAGKATVYMY